MYIHIIMDYVEVNVKKYSKNATGSDVIGVVVNIWLWVGWWLMALMNVTKN